MLFKKRTPGPTAPKRDTDVVVREVGPCQKALQLDVGPERIAPVRAVVVQEFCKRVTLPGFRQGKAPAALVEQKHGQAIQDETLHRVTQQVLERAMQDHGLKPVSPVELSRSELTSSGGLTLEATVEVEPSFALGEYKGIVLTEEPITVIPEEIERGLKSLQESMVPPPGSVPPSGGTVPRSNAPLAPPKAGQPGGGMVHLAPAGEGQPKERTVPPLDDELAKDLGFETLDRLRAHVEAKLREQKRTTQSHAVEQALCDELLRRHIVELPPRLVSRQAERVHRDFKARLLLSGMPQPQAEEETTRSADRLRQSAERHVKLGFILDRIAAQEAVSITEDEVVARLWQLARRWQKDPVEVRRLFDQEGLWPSVVSTLRQEQTMTLLMHAAVRDNGGRG